LSTNRTPLHLAFALLLTAPLSAHAATFAVPTDAYPTIQSAIDAAADGDEVVVAPGTYQVNLFISNKSITLRSEAGRAATILDGGAAGSVITASGNDAKFVKPTIQGFTIQNGSSSWGGGIYAHDDIQLFVRDCLVTRNAGYYGGGVAAYHNAWPELIGSEVSHNHATYAGGGGFGYVGAVRFIDSQVTDNASDELGGGAAGVWFCGGATITRSTFARNTARFGGAVYVGGDSRCNSMVQLESALVYGNTATVAGGAVAVMGGTMVTAWVTTSTLTGNEAPLGGAFYSEAGASLGILNSILWGNSTDAVLVPRPGSYPNGVAGSIVQGGVPADLAGADTNLDLDPAFADPAAADFRLTAGSPAIDLGVADGTITYPSASPATDLAGMTRQNGRVDAGAYEYDNVAPEVVVGIDGAMGAINFYLSPVDMTFTAVDGGVGPATVTVQFDGEAPITSATGDLAISLTRDGFYHFVWSATDRNGNEAVWRNHAITVDQTPAVTAVAVAGPRFGSWYRSAAVTVTATDATSGVARTQYAIDGAALVEVAGATAAFTLGDGRHAVTSGAADVAGNSPAFVTTPVWVDGIAPSVSVRTSVTSIKANNKTTEVRITGTATDATSGVASTVVTVTDVKGLLVATTTFGGTVQLKGVKGQRYTVTATATDAAGNAASKATIVTVQ
jgi:hypothetical protein